MYILCRTFDGNFTCICSDLKLLELIALAPYALCMRQNKNKKFTMTATISAWQRCHFAVKYYPQKNLVNIRFPQSQHHIIRDDLRKKPKSTHNNTFAEKHQENHTGLTLN